MNEELAAKIRGAPNLPTLPAIAIQVLELTQKPEVDIAEIARIISKDPALSSKILRTVNSSFYGRGHHVSTISHALVILGLQSVKTLVLGFSLVSNLSRDRAKGFNHIGYWKRSIYAATAARAIAAKVNFVQQEEAFLSRLLADIGMLVLDQVLGEQYGAVHGRIKSHHELVSAEREALGATHAEVGGMLTESWKLPPMLTVPIAQHHTPEAVSDPFLRKLTDLVALAGRCADVFVDEQAAAAIADVRKLFRDNHKLSEEDCDAVMSDIGKRTREVATLFEINIGSAAEYGQILKRANEALVEITLQSQQQVSTLAQKADNLAQENQQLQKKASTDALTGLSNRATFDAYLAEQFGKSMNNGEPMALLMIDLDRFKSINDKHGHPAGDAVLRAVAKILQTLAKAPQLAARYGGEELVVVLPGATRAMAATFAETARRTIAARPVVVGSTAIPVTASIGVSVFEPGCPIMLAQQLLKAADLAVYNAKKSGRNCVRVLALQPGKASAAATPAPT
jgi:diguanylate cyclase (GGDEF)-like protein